MLLALSSTGIVVWFVGSSDLLLTSFSLDIQNLPRMGEYARERSNITLTGFASSMAGGRILLPRDYCIPRGFERSELAKHPDVFIHCRPYAVAEFSQSVTRLRLCPVLTPPRIYCADHSCECRFLCKGSFMYKAGASF